MLLFSVKLSAQDIGSWRSFLSVNDARSLFLDDEQVWVATTGGLVSFNTADRRVVSLVDPVDGLYKTLSPTVARFNDYEYNKAIIGYQDGMLEWVNLTTFEVQRVDDIYRSTRYTAKQINDIFKDPVVDGRLWLSTAFGLVIYEQDGQYVENTITRFSPNSVASIAVLKSQILADQLFVLRPDGLYRAAISNSIDELILTDNWQRIPLNTSEEDFTYYDMHEIAEGLIVSTSDGLYFINTTDLLFSNIGPSALVHIDYDEASGLIVGLTSHLNENSAAPIGSNTLVYGRLNSTFEAVQTGLQSAVTSIQILNSERVLLTTPDQGLLSFDLSTQEQSKFESDGPYSNFFDGLSIDESTDRMIAGSTGQPQADGPESPSRGFYIYDLVEDRWESYNQLNFDPLKAVNFKSAFRSIEYNGSYFFGSWGQGILKFDASTLEVDHYASDEGVIGVAGGNYSVIHGLQKDVEGHLWALSHFSNRPLHFYDEQNNEWVSTPLFSATTSADVYRELLIDRNGRKWMTLKAIAGSGIVIADTGDPFDQKDDQSIKLTSEPLNGNLPSSTVNALLEDMNGEIWVGTSSGIGRFIFPDFIIEGGRAERTAQWLLNADTAADRPFLLPEINVSTMEIDGANQKWIGTPSDGLWVLNEDGSAVVTHFTSENSPILSNSIIDLCFHKSTGDMYISTDKGLMRFTTPTKVAKSSYSELSAFPNPLSYQTSSTTTITIEGLAERSRIKILSVDGDLIDEFSAIGGRAQWRAERTGGGQLASGIYIIAAIDLDGGETRTGKIVVIR